MGLKISGGGEGVEQGGLDWRRWERRWGLGGEERGVVEKQVEEQEAHQYTDLWV